jgi:Ni/Fe-hydrogenase 1 B-type cytochrome subunit
MSQQCKFKRYIWELPVRWSHWVNVTSIVTLAVTGIFIGTPLSIGRSPEDFTMGWIRFFHFVAAYTFTVSVLTRLLWSLVGNKYAGWREFFPLFSAKGRRKFVRMLRYYMFIDKEVPETIGHNPLAASAYTLLFCFYLIMIGTGFSLYAEHAPSGIFHAMFGWVQLFVSNQGLRLTHHLSMWFVFGFVINHIYSAWLMDIKEHGAEISSIFSGYRFTVHKEDD